MKIALVNNLYKPFNRGGAERIVELIADGFEKRGDESFIITTKPPESSASPEKNIYRLNSLYYNLNKIPIFFRLFWHLYNIFNLKNYFKIKKILINEQPDLVITNNLIGLGFLVPLVIKRLKIKHYHILHDIQLLYPSGLLNYGEEEKLQNNFARIYQFINNKLINDCQMIISPSKWLIREHLNSGFFKNSQTKVLPNPVIQKITYRNFSPAKKMKFLYVGQLENHKGISFLVKSFIKINTGKAELLIVGEGSKWKEVEDLSKDHYNIKFLGKLDGQEVQKIMSEADCLIVPSLCYENSPTVIYEAASNNLPVLASSLGGIPELLKDNEHLLFKPKDEKELMEKIIWAIHHQQELLIISRKISDNFTHYNIDEYLKSLTI